MSSLGQARGTFVEHSETIDLEGTNSTASLNISEAQNVVFQVLETGFNTDWVCTLECSLDDTNWQVIADQTVAFNTSPPLKATTPVNAKFVRITVTTTETGGTSTGAVIIQAK